MASRPLLFTLPVLAGCAQGLQATLDPAACDPRALSAGEVRARRIPCSDELQPGGEALRGDILLENAQIRAIFKSDHALSRHGGSGGTLVDLAPPDVRDGILEMVPLVDGQWLAEADLSIWQEGDRVGLDVQGTLPDGAAHSLTWTLTADATTLALEGADSLLMVPTANAARIGDTVESRSALSGGDALVYATDGVAADLGGWVRWDGVSQVHAGDRPAVLAARWPERIPVSGTTDGSAVSVFGPEGLLTRLPVVSGRFSGEVPAEATALRAWKGGHEDSESASPGTDLALPVGDPGFLVVRAEDPEGRPLPVTVWWGDERWWTGTAGLPLGVGPGTRSLLVSAGPRYSVADLGDVTVTDTVSVSVVLTPAHTDAALADLAVPAWPDPTTRRSASRQLAFAAARGARYAVTVADDEVPNAGPDADTARFLSSHASVRSPTRSVGGIQAWPWSRTSRRPAHGTPAWQEEDPADVLAVHASGGSRFTVVETDWLAAAGPVFDWDPAPQAVRVSGIADLEHITPALDAGAVFGLVGPWTWLVGAEARGPEIVEAERSLHTGSTVASNGPSVALEVLGLGPGDQIDAPWLPVTVTCSGPDWMPIQHATIIGEGGAELARFEAHQQTAPQVQGGAFLPAQRWLIATCEGDEEAWPELGTPAWAITSPLYGPL